LESNLAKLPYKFVIKQNKTKSKEETENCEGPGQFLRHYSPKIISFLFDGKYNA
jgi:hypothetical protein